MGSLFRLPSSQNTQIIHKSTRVIFKKIHCSVNFDNGDVKFNEIQESLHGILNDNHFAKGTMKTAYEVIYIS